MNEEERREKTERMAECIRLGEDAYNQLYEPRTHSHPAGHYSDAKDFFGEAIGLAGELGLEEQAAKLSERLAQVKAIYRTQFAGADSWPPIESILQNMPGPSAQPNLPTPDEIEAQFRRICADAALVVCVGQALSGIDFDYGLKSVEWLDDAIERLRGTRMSEAVQERLVSIIGAYLGEAVITAYGGEWALDGYGWHIRFNDENRAYPFSKTEKQFRFGEEDSIAAFLRGIAAFWTRRSPDGGRAH